MCRPISLPLYRLMQRGGRTRYTVTAGYWLLEAVACACFKIHIIGRSGVAQLVRRYPVKTGKW
jgi:hypothetical protein